jgi:acetolactate synthase-1/2/3 large subunit
LGIVADAATALRAINDALPPVDATPSSPGSVEESGRYAIGMHCHHPELLSDDDLPLKPARVLARLQAAFPDAFWACDQGEHTAYALHYLRIDGPDQFRAMLGLGSMGNGIGLGIGYQHARRDRTVICVCGDGGFAMHAGEILTCVEHGIDLIMVVMNDGRYNMVNHGFQSVFGRVPLALPSLVADIGMVAKGFGALSLCITKPADLDVVPHIAHSGKPLVLDVRIDPTLALSVGSRSATLQRAAFGGAL